MWQVAVWMSHAVLVSMPVPLLPAGAGTGTGTGAGGTGAGARVEAEALRAMSGRQSVQVRGAHATTILPGLTGRTSYNRVPWRHWCMTDSSSCGAREHTMAVIVRLLLS